MEAVLRVCANCRVLVEPAGADWIHVPALAEKFDRTVCDQPEPGRVPSQSEARFGLGRMKTPGGDKLSIKDGIAELAQPAGTPVTVAVDGSYKRDTTMAGKVIKPMSWSYLATNGMWGLGTSIVPGNVVGGDVRPDGSDPARTLQAELRAIANAVQAIGRDHPLLLLCDSKSALGYLALWRDGHDVMPGGYNMERSGGRLSTLARLARTIRENPEISWEWVRGHAGHPLNEGADALAKISRAWAVGRLDRDAVTGRAPQIVLEALTRHVQACPA